MRASEGTVFAEQGSPRRTDADQGGDEAAAKRVAGVLGLANDIEVRLPVISKKPDPEIARDAVAAIQIELPYSYEHIKVVVKNLFKIFFTKTPTK